MKTVAVLFGGRSLEHDVSVVSGLQILHAVDPDAFLPVPVYIDQANRWWIGESLWHTATFKGGGPDRSALTQVMLTPGFGTSLLTAVPDEGSAQSTHGPTPVDVFIPVLHGTYGEDGCIQGLFDLNGCAYVGSGVLASAVGMNKRVTKVLVAQAGVPIVPWLSVERSVLDRDAGWLTSVPGKVADQFGWPAIVKPANLGSSAGVSTAATPAELVAAVLRVFEYDVEALIEPFIKNRLELKCR
jgi:D-alanine-D-alanine ligase